MPSRKSPITAAFFQFLLRAHPAVGPVLAGVLFFVLRFAVPAALASLANGQPGGQSGSQSIPDALIHLSQLAAPFAAGLVIFVWAFALLHRFFDAAPPAGPLTLEALRKLAWPESVMHLTVYFQKQGYEVDAPPQTEAELRLKRANQLTLVQCKHWRAWQVGIKPVRELRDMIAAQQAVRGILITTGDFSSAAKSESAGDPALRLIDGTALEQMLRGDTRI